MIKESIMKDFNDICESGNISLKKIINEKINSIDYIKFVNDYKNDITKYALFNQFNPDKRKKSHSLYSDYNQINKHFRFFEELLYYYYYLIPYGQTSALKDEDNKFKNLTRKVIFDNCKDYYNHVIISSLVVIKSPIIIPF